MLKRDVFIDPYCYRKYGHNERNEATFHAAARYSLIKKKGESPEGLRRGGCWTRANRREGDIGRDIRGEKRLKTPNMAIGQRKRKGALHETTIDPAAATVEG